MKTKIYNLKKPFIYLLLGLFMPLKNQAQITPEISCWIVNTSGSTGYNGIPSNVQTVQYSSANVYVSCTCIPGYSIGPWQGNPNVASNQNFVFKITRNPQKNNGTLTRVGLGHTGVWSNGVSVFNADDGMTYNNQGVWNRNAYFWEGSSFDNCLGHPQQQGEYHHHVNPVCLYDDSDSSQHAPIIGYAFDGFPIYGAYGYSDTNGTGPVTRMRSSYQLRNITDRTTLPDGSAASFPGPPINATYPMGAFIQDYIFVQGSGDLDIHNGRFCVTPEYPQGIYAYFVTIDENLEPVFPYTMTDTYYGVVQPGNTGPGGGHVVISEPTTIYNPSTGLKENQPSIRFSVLGNPAGNFAHIYFDPSSTNNVEGELFTIDGRLLERREHMQPSILYSFDLTEQAAGLYLLYLRSGTHSVVQKIVKADTTY
jgi:hypothetical protein